MDLFSAAWLTKQIAEFSTERPKAANIGRVYTG